MGRLACLACAVAVVCCSCVSLDNGPGAAVETLRRPAAAPTTATPAAPAAPAISGPLEIGIGQAILLALEHNRSLAVERLRPAIARTFEGQAAAEFDPLLSADIETNRLKLQRLARTGAGTEGSVTDRTDATATVSKRFAGGATVSAEGSVEQTDSSLYSGRFNATRLGLTVTQALLRGLGTEANLANLRQARLATLASKHELRGFALTLVADVEQRYLDFYLAQRKIEIFTGSLKLAQQQLEETRESIKLGKMADIELAASQAEVALRREELINARSALAKARLLLLRLVNPPAPGLWQRQVVLTEQLAPPPEASDSIDDHARLASQLRPDLAEADLLLQQQNLEVVATKNGLLPKLDLFITLGGTGYAHSFGPALRNFDRDAYDYTAGVRLELPWGNGEAKALHRRARHSREQAQQALDNLAQLVELDVRLAYIEAKRAADQVQASAATRKLQEEKYRAETEKFTLGRSTSLLVGQAQRDLVASRIAEVEALVNSLKALVQLYRQDASLLDRRGVAVTGAD